MEKDNKYYTSSIEEFHVGFEYEAYIPEKETWSKEVFYLNKSHIDLIKYVETQNESTLRRIRVKYLDKEDIESLGFVKGDRREFDEFFNGAYKIYVFTQPLKNCFGKCTIEITDLTYEDKILFGKIKNKSELKKLMQQLSAY